ncbi:uncharacterized protein F4812DRAFT_378274 [Daldinia caldariorum]|uniref:uncharacterized protein n=1 Tax=Daldinia caldariorum TaxID=326644 RepID=UPI0020089C0F|nr:uncharacterized protein F4812DRAFT_378274 [Daldinia caldariorum]KAI1467838.1 hypothetical protein F4812DRAFT_378274 [Daldinia caldariorum]
MKLMKGPCNLWLPIYWKFTLPAILLITSFLLLKNLRSAQDPPAAIQDSHRVLNTSETDTDPLPLSHSQDAKNITINLVVATLRRDDISWTEKINLPNLNVMRYVTDDMMAPYHPPIPKKGREAMIYLTYMYDFYDELPDVTIFTHADESPWHVERSLNSSLVFALSHLDLNQVMQAQYFNLRVSWDNACPDWINTTNSEYNDEKQEESFMRQAFIENFSTNDVPEILAGPCCSQFAVTREAVRRHPKTQYQRNLAWLMKTDLSDFLSGRVWEHMWQYLFKGEAVDCPIEWKSYCRMYHICYDLESRKLLSKLELERKNLEKKTGVFDRIGDLLSGMKNKRRLREIDAIMAVELKSALQRGKSEAMRTQLLSDSW